MKTKTIREKLIKIICLICILCSSIQITTIHAQSDETSNDVKNKASTPFNLDLEVEANFKFVDAQGNPLAYTNVTLSLLGYEYDGDSDSVNLKTSELTTNTNSFGVATFASQEFFSTRAWGASMGAQIVVFVSFPSEYGVSKAEISNLAPYSLNYGNYTFDYTYGGNSYFESMDNPNFWGYDVYGHDVNLAISEYGEAGWYNQDYDHLMVGTLWYDVPSTTTNASGRYVIGSNDPVQVALEEYEHLTTITEHFEMLKLNNGQSITVANENVYSVPLVNGNTVLEPTLDIIDPILGNLSLRAYDLNNNRTDGYNNYTDDFSTIVYVNGFPVDVYYYYGRKIELTLDSNNGNSTPFDVITRWDDETFNLFNTPTSSDGRAFLGWNTQSDGNGIDVTPSSVIYDFAPSGNSITLYARWEESGYTIIFDKNGGIGEMESQSLNRDISGFLLENSFTRVGYRFDGWNTQANGGGISFSNMESVLNLANEGNTITLYAQWVANKYTLIYCDDLTSIDPIIIQMQKTYGEDFNLLENPFSKVGYHFVGWFVDTNEGRIIYDENETVSNLVSEHNGFILFQPLWAANDYVVMFDANTGSGIMTPQNFKYDVEQVLSANTFMKVGHRFVGWNTQANGEGTSYVNEALVKNLILTQNESVTLYAQWLPNQYKVNYYANTGEGTMSSQNMTFGVSETLHANTFTKIGYSFYNWSLMIHGGGTTYEDQELVRNLMTSGEINLYAQWLPNSYTIHFHANTGSGFMDAQLMRYDREKNLSANIYNKEGYHFIGWNTQENGEGTSYSDQQEVINLMHEKNGSMTLYAQWEANDYVVEFNANTGSGIMTPQNFEYDVEQALSANTFTKVGYHFVGWNTQPDGEGIFYDDQQLVINLVSGYNGVIMLYAQWEANKYGVIFSPNNRTSTIPLFQELEYDLPALLLRNTFIKEGYHFSRWNTRANGSGISYDDQQEVMNLISEHNAALPLYAQWEPNNYIIEFDSNTGEGTMTSQHFLYDKSQLLNSNNFTKLGYHFKGWNTQANGEGSEFLEQQEVLNLLTEGTMKLYAQWTPIRYFVVYDLGNGVVFREPKNYDEEFSLCGDVSLEGYHFLDWTTQADGDGDHYSARQVVSNLVSEQDEEFHLYAQFEANEFIVEFDKNTGEGLMSLQNFVYDVEQTLSTNTFSKSGYNFVGWNTQVDGKGIAYSNEEVVSNLVSERDAIIILYAQWEKQRESTLPETGVKDDSSFFGNSLTLISLGLGLLMVAQTKKRKKFKKNS